MTKIKLNLLKQSFNGKKVLITGHTGFKGSWLSAWLYQLGAEVVGIALEPPTDPSHFKSINISGKITDLRINICDYFSLEAAILSIKPDYIFHLAAQSLVQKSYINPVETWKVNLIGTINVLECLRKLKTPNTTIMITSDKCYNNIEQDKGYIETDSLGGTDPYSASKGAAELAIHSYVKSYFSHKGNEVKIASARAGNVIGGGDWANGRIVPDCVKAWANMNLVSLRHPYSTRPWQHVLEPLSGYLSLAMAMDKNPLIHGESFNFGPQPNQDHSVLELVKEMSLHWDQAKWQEASKFSENLPESKLLKLNCEKALKILNWHAAMDFKTTVRMTSQWYKFYFQQPLKISSATIEQISIYTDIAKQQGLAWAQ